MERLESMESRRAADEITHEIIGAAIAVHESLGPCLLESTYEECLALELCERGLTFARQLWLPIRYKSLILDKAYSVDLLVAGAIIVELKAVEKVLAVHEAQVLTYMKLSGHQRGLLLNFNVKLLKHGIRRFNLTEGGSCSSQIEISPRSQIPSSCSSSAVAVNLKSPRR